MRHNTTCTLDYIALCYTTLHYATLHRSLLYITVPFAKLHYPTSYYATNITLQDVQMLLHYSYNTLRYITLQLHHATFHPAVVGKVTDRWPLQPLQPLQKAQLQVSFGPSMDWPWHQWFVTSLFLKLPPPPCAVLLEHVKMHSYMSVVLGVFAT